MRRQCNLTPRLEPLLILEFAATNSSGRDGTSSDPPSPPATAASTSCFAFTWLFPGVYGRWRALPSRPMPNSASQPSGSSQHDERGVEISHETPGLLWNRFDRTFPAEIRRKQVDHIPGKLRGVPRCRPPSVARALCRLKLARSAKLNELELSDSPFRRAPAGPAPAGA